ncbi:MAG: replicative DNA helicase [Myxococcales bacterium]|nr:replicative DNA helicase [Myxococcales bacterium]
MAEQPISRPEFAVPQDIEAERSVLGAILLDPTSALTEIGDRLKAEDFYSEQHRVIFRAMYELAGRDEPIDLITVAGRLRVLGHLETAGGAAYLTELSSVVPTTIHARAYADIVKQKSTLRSVMSYARETLYSATAPQEDIEKFIDDMARKANAIATSGVARKVLSLREALEPMIMQAEQLANAGRRGLTGVPTGFHALDKRTNGLQPGDLLILAARPGMGKTALALNLLVNAARDKRRPTPGVIFSLEMGAGQLAQRLWASSSKVPMENIRSGDISKTQWTALYNSFKDLADLPIFIDETSSIPIGELMRKCRQLKQEHGIGLVMIDYLQLMSGAGSAKNVNREQIISEISRNLKALARELELPVIALSQLNRGVESREDKRPLLSDLRESGAIEQDADIIMFLYRDSYYQAMKGANAGARVGKGRNGDAEAPAPAAQVDPSLPATTELILAKHRSGATGTVELTFLPKFLLFTNKEGDGPPTPDEPIGMARDTRTTGLERDFSPPPPLPDPTLSPGSDDPRAPWDGPMPPAPEFRPAHYHLQPADDDDDDFPI